MKRPSHRLKVEVWERDKRCQICGSKHNLTVDHLKQVKDGGNNDLSNLKTLCNNCHIKKDRHKLYIYNFETNLYETNIHRLGVVIPKPVV
jgi:5-methylcytosine-specific restriction endonuclease McrA